MILDKLSVMFLFVQIFCDEWKCIYEIRLFC